jgi:hypothetical protein
VGASGGAAKGTSLNRLTQSYVVSAISGMAIITAAVVAFVMLVSLQTLQEWPISGLGLGNRDNSGATRPPEKGTPTPNQTIIVAPSASPPTQAPIVAAGTARNGQAGLGDGSAIAGGANETGDESTGAPTAVSPSPGSGPSSDAGSAAPVESTGVGSTGAGSGSGSEGNDGGDSVPGSRSASGVREGPPDESAATPTGQGESADSSAGSVNSGKDRGVHGGPAKTSDSSNPASTKTKPPTSKSKPSSTKSAPEPAAPESTPASAGKPSSTKSAPEPAAPESTPEPTSASAASDKGAGKPPGPHPHGDPGGSQ